jgi:methionyl-tRNA formyltransferase
MKILTLGSSAPLLHQALSLHTIIHTEEPLNHSDLTRLAPDFIVSFGYRHFVRQPIIDAFPNKIINLHISLLPWNRGADPNFWSWFDGTPKGVTIHEIDVGLDTGDILTQREIQMSRDETLASSYQILQDSIVGLFESTVAALLNREIRASPQPPNTGSFHKSDDKSEIFAQLPNGWDTSCSEIEEFGRQRRMI